MIHLFSNLWRPSLPDSQWHLHSWKNLELWVYYLLLAASFDMPLTAKATQSSKPACLWILCKCPHNLCQPCLSNVKSSCQWPAVQMLPKEHEHICARKSWFVRMFFQLWKNCFRVQFRFEISTWPQVGHVSNSVGQPIGLCHLHAIASRNVANSEHVTWAHRKMYNSFQQIFIHDDLLWNRVQGSSLSFYLSNGSECS